VDDASESVPAGERLSSSHDEREVGSILLLGEGDLSFARAIGLSKRFLGTTVTATELGTPSDVCSRYFNGSSKSLMARCAELLELGVHVALGVDVTRLECSDTCYHWRDGTFVQAPLWAAEVGPPSSSLVIFNFPHTTRPGKTAKLLKQCFRSLRACIATGFARPGCRVEMRLRHEGHLRDACQLIRSRYGHEEAAAAACYDLVSVAESDLDSLEAHGYEHRSTKRNARCGHLEFVNVWTWQAARCAPPSVQALPDGCRRDVFFAPEEICGRELRPHHSWNGERDVPHYLVRWRGHPARSECTWEPARDVGLELRRAYDAAEMATI